MLGRRRDVIIAAMLDSLLAADAGLRAWLATHHAPWLDGILWTLSALGVGGSIWIAIAAVMASWVPRLRAPRQHSVRFGLLG